MNLERAMGGKNNRRRCDGPQREVQKPPVAPDSTQRPLRASRHGVADTFPFTADGHELLAGQRLGASPLLAMGEVFALGAAPRGIREEVLGLDRKGYLANQPSGPAEVLDRPGGLMSLEPRLGGLEQHVEAELGDDSVLE